MDGTLIDSEVFTDHAVNALCREHGVADVDTERPHFYGVSFLEIARQLRRDYRQLPARLDCAARLEDIYDQLLLNDPPGPIHQAREAVVAANQVVPTAIVSSSRRASIEETIARMVIADHIDYFAGAEDYENSKPAPDGYNQAAGRLGVRNHECLVFEDSIVGIQAAKSAGMQVVAITYRSNDIALATQLADHAITDFSELDAEFFDRVSTRNRG